RVPARRTGRAARAAGGSPLWAAHGGGAGRRGLRAAGSHRPAGAIGKRDGLSGCATGGAVAALHQRPRRSASAAPAERVRAVVPEAETLLPSCPPAGGN